MFELVPLGQLAKIEMGQSPDSKYVYESAEGGMAFLQGNAEFGENFPIAKYSCLQPVKMCRKGDLLISVRAPVGQINIADREYCIGRGLAAISFNKLPPTLGRGLIEAARNKLRLVAQGSTFEAVNKSDLLSLLIACPPSEEVEVLKGVVDTVDDSIRQTEAIIVKLQQVKQGLLHDLLTRGIDENGQLRPPYEQTPELYKDSPLGWIPKEWELKQAGEICTSIVPGRNKPALHGGELPWITVSDLLFEYVSESLEGLSLTRRALRLAQGRTIQEGAVIMSCVGSFGEVAIAGQELVINQQLHGFVPGDQVSPEWLMYNLKLRQGLMEKNATQTTILYLNKSGCESIPVLLPCLEEQEEIVRRIKSLSSKKSLEEDDLMKLKKQKSGLMDDLLTGRVRVTELIEQQQQAS